MKVILLGVISILSMQHINEKRRRWQAAKTGGGSVSAPADALENVSVIGKWRRKW